VSIYSTSSCEKWMEEEGRFLGLKLVEEKRHMLMNGLPNRSREHVPPSRRPRN